jgi:hypothetical protein
MSIALGRNILGIIIALGGVSVMSRHMVTDIVIFAVGIALFFWGVRTTERKR